MSRRSPRLEAIEHVRRCIAVLASAPAPEGVRLALSEAMAVLSALEAAARGTNERRRPMIENSEGRRLLLVKLATTMSRTKLEGAIDTSQSAISLWCSGRRVPGGHARAELARVLQIPVDAWDRASIFAHVNSTPGKLESERRRS